MDTTPGKRRSWFPWVIVGLLMLALVLIVAWAWGKKIADQDQVIDTWAEGLGLLGTVGEGMDALGQFWTWVKGLFGSGSSDEG